MSRTYRGVAAFALLICLTALSALAADEPQTPGLAAGTDLAGRRRRIVFISGAPSRWLRPARAICRLYAAGQGPE